jgi:hypothetical protein
MAPHKAVAPPPGIGPKPWGPDPWEGTVGQRDGALYCAEQVLIPPSLEDVVRRYTKAVLKEKPSDSELVSFSARWFAREASQK